MGSPPVFNRRQLLTGAFAAGALALTRLRAADAASTQRKVVVTIDDGPATGTGRELEPFLRIADALREAFVAEKVPAIMFVNERQLNVEGQRDARGAVLQRWLDAGLELGNHCYSHLNGNDTELPRYLDDIVKGEVLTRAMLESRGQRLIWFRYPFLATGKGENAKLIEEFLALRGYRIAPVSISYQDYTFAGAYSRHLRAGEKAKADEQFQAMLQALDVAFERAEKRSVEVLGYELPQTLLIHCNELNADTLRTSLQRIRDRGYAFVSMDKAMRDPAYATPGLKPGAMGGGGFLNSVAAARRPRESSVR